jgi:glycosyltransferase involved in cell wall biosynthesis
MYGAEVMLLNLVTEQIRQGLYPVIGSIGSHDCGEKAIEIEARKHNVPVKIFRMYPGPNLVGALKIMKYTNSMNFDIVPPHGYKGNILLGFISKRFRRFPIIATIHGWVSTGTQFSRMRVYEWLDSLVLPQIDGVVLVNKGMLKHPKLDRRKNIKLYIVNNGIGIQQPVQYPCELLKLSPPVGLNIVAVGRLSIEKGFDILLKALALVIKKGEDISLVLFGEGCERSTLEALVYQLDLQERVKMPGFVENVASTFHCFDFLMMPSLTEGLPITLLEAMRAKLPVIASKVGGIPNVLEDGLCGLLVEAKNIEELANAIIKFSKSKSLRRQFANRAFEAFQKSYSAKNMTESYTRIYSHVLIKDI